MREYHWKDVKIFVAGKEVDVTSISFAGNKQMVFQIPVNNNIQLSRFKRKWLKTVKPFYIVNRLKNRI